MARLALALAAAPAAAAVRLSEVARMDGAGTMETASYPLIDELDSAFAYPSSEVENCACLAWADVYTGFWYHNESASKETDKNFKTKFFWNRTTAARQEVNGIQVTYASCGDGHEMTPHHHDLELGQEPVWEPEKEYCLNFFTKLNKPGFNDCMNVARVNPEELNETSDALYGGSWCYVGPNCSAAIPKNGTTGIGQVKRCRAGQDSFLGSRSPGELYNLSQEMDLDMSTLVKMAYPVVRDPEMVNISMDGTLVALENVTADGPPVVLDSPSSHPSFIVQHGFSQYHVLDNLDHMRMGRPQTFTEFVCANASYQPCRDSVVVNKEIQAQLYSW